MEYDAPMILGLLIALAVVFDVDAFSQTGGRLLVTRSSRSDSDGHAISSRMSMSSSSSKTQQISTDSLEDLKSSASSSFLSLKDSKCAAFPQQTPHSGRHFLPTHPSTSQLSSPSSSRLQRVKSKILQSLNPFRRASRRSKHSRFMEGWYYRITLPEEKVSFAFIFSIEDPNPEVDNGELSLAAVQVMGPNDEYVVQADKDHSKFWAWEHSQAFGYTFEEEEESMNDVDGNKNNNSNNASATENAMTPEEFRSKVKTGFQILPTSLQGKVNGHDGSKGGVLEGQGIPRTCDFDMEITPLSGWGDDNDVQKSTAGWLASYSVFEPHWQVTMADARATGYATWDGKRYDFENVPFYAEKNWGGSFPSKWYWVQCNSFQGYAGTGTAMSGDSSSILRLSLTAGGGTRKVPFGRTEDLGMVSVHHNGKFYEAVPWTGEMSWDVEPWGSWSFNAKCTSGERLFEVNVTAKCDEEGVVLRAPTEDLGLAYFCRDSFFANCNLSLHELVWDINEKEYVRGDTIIDNAKSINKTCAVEIGGGPYWNAWKKKSRMVQPIKALVKLPYLFQNSRKRRRNKKV